MLHAAAQVPPTAVRLARRREPLTYSQALEFARQLVAQEAYERGSDISADALELAAAKRAAQVFRQSF